MTEQRKRGPIICKPGSKRAKQIEETHGFNASVKARKKRDDAGSTDEKDASR